MTSWLLCLHYPLFTYPVASIVENCNLLVILHSSLNTMKLTKFPIRFSATSSGNLQDDMKLKTVNQEKILCLTPNGCSIAAPLIMAQFFQEKITLSWRMIWWKPVEKWRLPLSMYCAWCGKPFCSWLFQNTKVPITRRSPGFQDKCLKCIKVTREWLSQEHVLQRHQRASIHYH